MSADILTVKIGDNKQVLIREFQTLKGKKLNFHRKFPLVSCFWFFQLHYFDKKEEREKFAKVNEGLCQIPDKHQERNLFSVMKKIRFHYTKRGITGKEDIFSFVIENPLYDLFNKDQEELLMKTREELFNERK